MKYRQISLPALSLLSTAVLLLQTTAQTAPSAPAMAAPQQVAAPAHRKAKQFFSFKFEGADLDTVMETYCQWTEKTYLKNNAVTATITLKASGLTKEECIQVVEAILGMNNIALVPMGEKFLKVVQSTAPDLVGQGLKVNLDPGQQYGNSDKLVTQIIQLENVEIPEVQTAVQHLMHAYGKIQTLERSNSLMITDTESNIVRIRELIEFIDQPSAGIEPHIYKIEHADATEIAAKLNEIIAAAQEDQSTTSARTTSPRTPAGIIRARTTRQTTKPTAPSKATISTTERSGAPIIQGHVKVLADERTSIVIIFSQEENFEFFDKIIKVLDVEVDPAITFEVVNLEYADAKELAGTLNELVGAATSSRGGSSSSASRTSSSRTRTSGIQRANSRSTSSRNTSSRNTRVSPKASPSGTTIQNLSRLSEETRILSDERSNSVLLMGQKADIAALKEVIKSLDIMLEQVVIEAAIFEVTLDDKLRHGIEWLYNRENARVGAWDGASLSASTNAFGIAANALTYYRNLDINSKMAINLSKQNDDVRLLQNPIIMTTDNTEASIKIGEQQPVVTSTDSFGTSSGTLRSSYEYKDIGIQLTVTPHINPEGYVVMEVSQKADELGPSVTIDENEVPTIVNREFEATIAVPNKSTVVLGGLVRNKTTDNINKIPILGDIPLIGRYLFSNVVKKNEARELIVLLTPSVLATIMEAEQEAERLYRATDIMPQDWPLDWSASKLQQISGTEKEPVTQNEPCTQNTASPDLESQKAALAEKNEKLELLNGMDQ